MFWLLSAEVNHRLRYWCYLILRCVPPNVEPPDHQFKHGVYQKPSHGYLWGANQVSSQLAWCNERSKWIWGSKVDSQVASGALEDRILMVKICIEESQCIERMRGRPQATISPPT